MCTILILNRIHPVAPVVIAANRDELYARPATPPQILDTGGPPALGGKDLLAGGTWMGLNARGLFVGLTNRGPGQPDRRSRGELVLNALGLTTAGDVERLIRSTASAGEYSPFNLLYGTATELRVACVEDDQLETTPVPPGLHVLPSSGRLDDPIFPKVERASRLLQAALANEPADPAADPVEELGESLLAVLADHDKPTLEELPAPLRGHGLGADFARQLQALCVHTPGYGTRSSTLVTLTTDDTLPRYYFSPGPACRGRWERFDPLLWGRSAS
jgi:uncharacterized protein with NRDE domain